MYITKGFKPFSLNPFLFAPLRNRSQGAPVRLTIFQFIEDLAPVSAALFAKLYQCGEAAQR